MFVIRPKNKQTKNSVVESMDEITKIDLFFSCSFLDLILVYPLFQGLTNGSIHSGVLGKFLFSFLMYTWLTYEYRFSSSSSSYMVGANDGQHLSGEHHTHPVGRTSRAPSLYVRILYAASCSRCYLICVPQVYSNARRVVCYVLLWWYHYRYGDGRRPTRERTRGQWPTVKGFVWWQG